MQQSLQNIRCLFTDIDDTISTDGKITSKAYDALWRAQQAGLAVVPVTGRPAGWCDHIVRMWPVDGVIGENGGLYMRMTEQGLQRVFRYDADARADFRHRLEQVREEILAKVPGCGVASDQPYREYDLAIDFCEDVEPLAQEAVTEIVRIFESHGATAKISSIHVNGWFGEFDKLTMAEQYTRDVFGVSLREEIDTFAFCGDSPNDEPMFAFFTHSFGVANVRGFLPQMKSHPTTITQAEAGAGFTEVVDSILRDRQAVDPRPIMETTAGKA
ncbi:MAG: HAD-IIB family hydrolase [Verrucomicrobia bacterium]|jgi:HAD superfamily hydrolase (TIGR01484 family)|nr:HAD-IIB family hydrolase [Verrucomicrobiota bacterium]